MAKYELTRTTEIAAPAARILPLITSFPEWRRWSPFEDQDADLVRDYRGAERGIGAVYEYSGKRAGRGIMTITDATEQRVAIGLEFLKPFKSTSEHEFLLREDAGSTTVSWTMTGEQNAMLRAVFPVTKVMGPVFDKGLAALKAAAEAEEFSG